MTRLSKEELLESLEYAYRYPIEKPPKDLRAYKEIKALIEASKKVTEEWIEEKAVELYNYLYYDTFCLDQVRGFIRLLVEEMRV